MELTSIRLSRLVFACFICVLDSQYHCFHFVVHSLAATCFCFIILNTFFVTDILLISTLVFCCIIHPPFLLASCTVCPSSLLYPTTASMIERLERERNNVNVNQSMPAERKRNIEQQLNVRCWVSFAFLEQAQSPFRPMLQYSMQDNSA